MVLQTTPLKSGHVEVSRRRAFSPRAFLLGLLSDIEAGQITIELPSGERITQRAALPGPEAVIVVRRWRGVWRTIIGGELGFARAYMDDDLGTPDIRALLEFAVRNEKSLAAPTSGSLLARGLNRLKHFRRANTRRGSKRNIEAHYDLGNAFYEKWLDATMNYSSAYFAHPGQTLEEAQQEKLHRIVDLLDTKPGDQVLEIGCGWGALAERLVEKGCSVTGVTLSEEQLSFARKRLAAHRDKAEIRLQDYRDIPERYDAIVSVEMIEAVGERYWPAYFERLRNSLTDAGTVVLQAITIAEERFSDYRGRPDFIQRYIFPGGMLPTIDIIRREAERVGLKVMRHEPFGQSYAVTLAEWRRRFVNAWPQIEPLGFDARFKRMWEYYLAYCEVGFRLGTINVGWFKLARA